MNEKKRKKKYITGIIARGPVGGRLYRIQKKTNNYCKIVLNIKTYSLFLIRYSELRVCINPIILQNVIILMYTIPFSKNISHRISVSIEFYN